MRLIDELREKAETGRIPFHMPGHARDASRFDWLGDAARVDFTEIDGLDDLHAPEGILRDAMERAAAVWGARRSFFLVGGSTVGILAAVTAVCRTSREEHPAVLMARNCHRSVYSAILLNRARPRYLVPDVHPLGFFLDLKPEALEAALSSGERPTAVIVTSPTYDGAVSDLASLADLCHRHGIPLIADAAHGAHLGFLDPAVPSPVACGADVTVMSLHKTLPSLTQTGILHTAGSLVDPDSIAEALHLLETSSPSYPLMASIDGCADAMGDPSLFADWWRRIRRAREAGGDLFPRPECFACDESKLILAVPGLTGPETTRILRERFRIEPEMTAPAYVLLMTTAGTSDAHIDALIAALEELGRCRGEPLPPFPSEPVLPEQVLEPWEAGLSAPVSVPLGDAVGHIAAETVMAYPPGIPLLVPGERLGPQTAAMAARLLSGGANLLNPRGAFDGFLRVLREEAT